MHFLFLVPIQLSKTCHKRIRNPIQTCPRIFSKCRKNMNNEWINSKLASNLTSSTHASWE